jgi:hypothetical protein
MFNRHHAQKPAPLLRLRAGTPGHSITHNSPRLRRVSPTRMRSSLRNAASTLLGLLLLLVALSCHPAYGIDLEEGIKLLEQRRQALSHDSRSSVDEERLRLAELFEILAFVEERANTINHRALRLFEPDQRPKNVDDVLERGAGICGNQTDLFHRLARALAFETRSVQFYYRDTKGVPRTHIAAEVRLAGAWRFFDPTYKAVFRESSRQGVALKPNQLLSVAEIRALGFDAVSVVHDPIDGWKLVHDGRHATRFGFYEYLFATGDEGGLVVGMDGAVRPFEARQIEGVVAFGTSRIPNYVGVTVDHEGGALGSTRLRLTVPAGGGGGRSVEVDWGAVACVPPAQPVIEVRRETGKVVGKIVAEKGGTGTLPLSLSVPEGEVLTLAMADDEWLKSAGFPCYALWNEVRIRLTEVE